jgi:hypothetical protein
MLGMATVPLYTRISQMASIFYAAPDVFAL